MPKTIVIDPGESKTVDLKIKIIFPKSINSFSNIIGRFGIQKNTRKSFDIEIRHADSFLLRDGNVQVNIKNNSQKHVTLREKTFPISLYFLKKSRKYPDLRKDINQDSRNNWLHFYSIPIKLEKLESTKPTPPPIVQYETIKSEDSSYLIPIPRVGWKKCIDLQLPKTEIINPGETNVIDLKIKIFLPKYKNTPILIGRLNIGLEAIDVYNIEIKHHRSFIEKDGKVYAHITNKSNEPVTLKVGHYYVSMYFVEPGYPDNHKSQGSQQI